DIHSKDILSDEKNFYSHKRSELKGNVKDAIYEVANTKNYDISRPEVVNKLITNSSFINSVVNLVLSNKGKTTGRGASKTNLKPTPRTQKNSRSIAFLISEVLQEKKGRTTRFVQSVAL